MSPLPPTDGSPDPGSPSPPVPVSAEDQYKITILFKEYDTLRQEILGRIGSRFTLISIGGGLGVLLGLQRREPWHDYVLMAWAVAALVLWWWTGLLISRCAARVMKIEQRINDLAKDQLLGWETHTENLHRESWWRRLYPGKLVHRQPKS
jgi:hypothetical protein